MSFDMWLWAGAIVALGYCVNRLIYTAQELNHWRIEYDKLKEAYINQFNQFHDVTCTYEDGVLTIKGELKEQYKEVKQ